ncbi:MAG: DNA cytosine methyltransferase [Candidatus Micrarchaeota archaeon]|nr:DNA cytosine methyltransferase [Candidatus Micrarchaeota archaeon]
MVGMRKKRLTNVSLFSGAFGLDLGLEKAGFETVFCIDTDPVACETIGANRPTVKVIEGSVSEMTGSEILRTCGLKRGEPDLVNGGPPCQSFSTAGKRHSIRDPRGFLVFDFIRLVDEMQPKAFMMENVRGLLSAKVDEKGEAAGDNLVVNQVVEGFKGIGYSVSYRLLNSAEYGVAQKRERVFFIGRRDRRPVAFPETTHAEHPTLTRKKRFRTLGKILEVASGSLEEFTPYSSERLKYLRLVPAGGNWRSLPEEMQKDAMKGGYESEGGKVGYFRRLDPDKPCPTVTTSPTQKATDLCHPYKDRPLSVLECSLVQGFPKKWRFAGNTADKYRQIGNAVPIPLATAVGRAVAESLATEPIGDLDGGHLLKASA